MGLRKLLALLLLLQAGSAQLQAGAGPGAGATVFRLCGRELVRAVIFTCGASRWKRISAQGQPGMVPPPRADFVQLSSDERPQNNNLLSVLDPMLEQLRSISQPAGQWPLKDLFHSHDDYIESALPSDNFKEYIRQAEDAALKRGELVQIGSSESLDNVKLSSASNRELQHLQGRHRPRAQLLLGSFLDSHRCYKKAILTAAEDAGHKNAAPAIGGPALSQKTPE